MIRWRVTGAPDYGTAFALARTVPAQRSSRLGLDFAEGGTWGMIGVVGNIYAREYIGAF